MNIPNNLTLKKIAGGFLIFALMWGPAGSSGTDVDTENLQQTIQYLLTFVENSRCLFFRNNKAHTAQEAAAHMQRKYAHFKDEIKTPEDFIRLAATKSLMTGKLYYVKLPDGEKITSEAWLLRALDAYRQKQK